MNDRTENGVAAGGRRHYDRSIAGGTRGRRQPAPRDPRGRHAGHRGADLAAECDQRGAGAAHRFGQRRQAHRGHHGPGRQDRGRAHRRAASPTSRSAIPRSPTSTPLTDRCALDPRQEDRHHAGHGLRRRQAAGRHVRHRGVLRHLAPRRRARAASRRRHQGVVGQRPHHAVGHLADARDARQGGDHRPAVRARHHQYGAGAAAAAGHAGGALHRGQLAQAGRELGVQWNMLRPAQRSPTSAIARRPASFRSPTPAAACSQQPRRPTSSAAPTSSPGAVTISPIAAAGVLSGTAPFGFLLGRMITDGALAIDVIINALEQKGLARTPGRAEPGGAVRRHRELPRRRRISRSRCRARSAR